MTLKEEINKAIAKHYIKSIGKDYHTKPLTNKIISLIKLKVPKGDCRDEILKETIEKIIYEVLQGRPYDEWKDESMYEAWCLRIAETVSMRLDDTLRSY